MVISLRNGACSATEANGFHDVKFHELWSQWDYRGDGRDAMCIRYAGKLE
jgi:hypothetical protein